MNSLAAIVLTSAALVAAAAPAGAAAGHRRGERAMPCRGDAYMGVALSRDIDCGDQGDAAGAYRASLNGDVGRFYPWYHGDRYGTFLITREYRDGGALCRDFHAVSYRNGYRFADNGTACRRGDGAWETQ
jgi:surface antigen